MKKKNIAINGFGRIGRSTLRAILQNPSLQVMAINDLADPNTLAHLLRFDSTYGKFAEDVYVDKDDIVIRENRIQVFSEKDPTNLPWKRLGIDLVIECTGKFTDYASLSKHIEAGAKKVLLSAPAKDSVRTVVLGVNDGLLSSYDTIVSNSSCTTNCLAPIVKVLNDNFVINSGFMTTVHAYTTDQNLLDAPHKDLRRARSAARSIIPTSTGAATSMGLIIPEMQGKLHGIAMRVPVENGSAVDLTAVLNKDVSAQEVNSAVKNASLTYLKGILEYSEDPLVSVDVIGNRHSCVFDSKLTVTNGNLVKVVAWYDNENAYALRMVELALLMLR